MKKKSEFSAAERERIAREYLTGNETARELSLKYGVKDILLPHIRYACISFLSQR